MPETNGNGVKSLKIMIGTLLSIIVLMASAWSVDLRLRTAQNAEDIREWAQRNASIEAQAAADRATLITIERRLNRIETKIDVILQEKR